MNTLPLPNELIRMISNHLPLQFIRHFRSTCRQTWEAIPVVPLPGRVTDAIRPFFYDVAEFRVSCLQAFDCIIAGSVPFLILAGANIASSDILDLFVEHGDALSLCIALEGLRCQFHVTGGIATAESLFTALSSCLSTRDVTQFPPTQTETVTAHSDVPFPPRLGSTALEFGRADPILASLIAMTPRNRWLRVHVLKTGRPVGDAIYAMPSTAYMSFISHEEIYSFSRYVTFAHGCHLTFEKHVTFTPIDWPPPIDLKCVARMAEAGLPPYHSLLGASMRRRVWTKPWDNGDGQHVDLYHSVPESKPFAGTKFYITPVLLHVTRGFSGDRPSVYFRHLYGEPGPNDDESDRDLGIIVKAV